MKCPKCGYLGFETTDRCRNCGYDFSLTPVEPPPELSLRGAEVEGPMAELRLYERESAEAEAERLVPERPQSPTPELMRFPSEAPPPGDTHEELPLFPPRPAGNPLAVRRATTDAPRPRRSTTRPVRAANEGLPLAPDATETSLAPARTAAARPEAGGLLARLAAATFDLVLLLSIDAAVLWLTLRIAGLDFTEADLRLIRPLPMAAFLLLLAFLYLVGFTIGGGQTLGKMLFRLKVIGDGGQAVDLAGVIIRSVGCLLSVLLLGLPFVTAFMTGERRALYDRLAGTRVVKA